MEGGFRELTRYEQVTGTVSAVYVGKLAQDRSYWVNWDVPAFGYDACMVCEHEVELAETIIDKIGRLDAHGG